MKHVASLKAIRSDGEVFNYQSDSWELRALEGFDFPEIETSKQARGVGDGDIITGQRRVSRDMKIVARPLDVENYNLQRMQAIAFHNSRMKYDLHINYLGTERIAKDCQITASNFPLGNVYKMKDLTIRFLSSYADLFAVDSEQTNFIIKQAMWVWPHTYKSGKPLNFASNTLTTEKVINYIGSSPAKPIIEIESIGYAKNLEIVVNKNIAKLNIEMHKGDYIYIDTSMSYAVFNNQILAFDEDQDPYDFRKFLLDFGDNIVKVDAEIGSSVLRTNVTYVGRYDGL